MILYRELPLLLNCPIQENANGNTTCSFYSILFFPPFTFDSDEQSRENLKCPLSSEQMTIHKIHLRYNRIDKPKGIHEKLLFIRKGSRDNIMQLFINLYYPE